MPTPRPSPRDLIHAAKRVRHQREYPLSEGETLLSVTDLKGRIVYANDAFIRVSGFEAAELYGKAHSIVRHPDMPAAAFARHVVHHPARAALERPGQEPAQERRPLLGARQRQSHTPCGRRGRLPVRAHPARAVRGAAACGAL